MIQKRWPLWLKLLMAPIALAGALASAPLVLLLAFADFDKAEAIMDFWTEQQ